MYWKAYTRYTVFKTFKPSNTVSFDVKEWKEALKSEKERERERRSENEQEIPKKKWKETRKSEKKVKKERES